MRHIIAEKYPDHGIFGEEEGMKQPKTGDDQYLWVLDPIDGTKSFITGKPFCKCCHLPDASTAKDAALPAL